MAFVTSGSAQIYYEVYQTGDRPWLAFAHGAGGNAAIWWQQVPFFYQWYNVMVFDHRTFGRSTCTPEDFDTKHYAGDLQAILDAAGIEQAALVCQSMGGRTGLWFALNHPERVRALVMSHTIGNIYTEEIRAARLAANATRPTPQGPFDHWAFAQDFPAKNPAGAHLYNSLSRFNVHVDRDRLGYFNPETNITPEMLKDFRIPTLFVTGQKDVVLPPAIVHMAAACVPGCELVDLRDVGHSSYFEMPEQFNNLVRTFLQKVEKA